MRKRLTSIFRRRLSEERGIALILTLAIIALVTLLLIAFVTSMRVENGASKSFNDLVKTRELALGAIDQAVATIRQATPERTDASAGNFSTYVTFPGVIWTNNNGAYGPVYLYSAPTSTDTTNLNAGFWITGQNPVEFPNEANSAINVGWLYVAQDPTTAPGPANPIIGRYVFWTDDEASKINLNTAGQPPLPPVPDYGTSTSTDVDLSVLLPGLSAAAITARQAVPAFTPATPGYNTIEEVKLADSPANADSDFNTNRFYLTTYSNDANYPSYQDDLDAFGRLRRPLFFPVAAAVSQLDLLPTTVGGAYQRMIDPTLTAIYGGTFGGIGGKYPPVAGGADGVQQIIANIIAYQHDPQSGLVADFPPDGFGNPPPYLGLARVPYINEVQVKYTDNGNGTVSRTVSVELYYPYSADAPYTSGVVGTEDTITLLGLPVGVPATFPGGPVTITVPGSTVFNNGTPQVFTSVSAPATVAAPPTTVTFLPASIFVNYLRHGHRVDFAQLTLGVSPSGVTLNIPVPPPAGTAVYQGAEVKDPWVNELASQWVGYDTGGGSLGLPNAIFSPTASILSKAHIRAAPIQSLGELGYIHTPNPVQYLTLQPGGGAAPGQIPDWVLMDLFTVGNTAIPNITAGRININGFINPGFPITNVRRLVPLKALLNSAISPPDTVAQQIYDDITRSVGIDVYGMRNGRDGIFDTIGEICEAPGIADNAAALQADREKVVRRIANLITVRSSAFTIWVMAQSIKQPPGSTLGTYNPGVDLITGEVKAQAVVERYESNPGVAGSVPRFRTRYFRYLYN